MPNEVPDEILTDPSAPVPLAGGSLKPGAARAMPPGRYLTFGVLPALRGLKPKSDAPDPQPDVVADWSRDHPALRLTSFDALVVAKPIAITPGDTIRTLVRGSTGPLIVEGIQESSHAIVCCFDVLQSNWPFDVGFVLFLASSVQYLGEDQAEAAGQRLTPGEMLSAALPAGVKDATVNLPKSAGGGSATVHTGTDGRVAYGPLRTAGLYTLRWTGPAAATDVPDGSSAIRAFAVNLFDPTESRIEARQALALPGGAVKAGSATGAGAGERRLWPWLVIGAIVLVLLEWFIYNRKTYL